MTPRDVEGEQVATFAARVLRGRLRVLCVGSASVATRLATADFAVTPLEARDLDAYRAEDPFDAIVATRVLSTSLVLADTVTRLGALLTPIGRIVFDELDHTFADEATLAWYYHRRDRLAAPTTLPPLARARWHDEHGADHDGGAIQAAISQQFAFRQMRRVEYMYRELARLLPPTADGERAAATLRASERHDIEHGVLQPVGLQVVADRGVASPEDACGVTMSSGVACSRPRGHVGPHYWRSADGHSFEWD